MLLKEKNFYFVRHAESIHNQMNLCAGSTIDSLLSKNGIHQAHLLKTQINNLKLDQVISSPLLRAKNTAEIIWEETLLLDEGLREFDYGIFEGTPDIGITEYLMALPYDKSISQGDSKKTFIDKVFNCFNKWLNTDIENLLFVSHGGTFVALLYIMDIPFFDLENAQLAHFTYISKKWTVSVCEKVSSPPNLTRL